FVLSQDQTLHDSLIAHLFALLPRTFVIDSDLYNQTRTLALIHCIVQFSKNRVASCDLIMIASLFLGVKTFLHLFLKLSEMLCTNRIVDA
ncbi:hypothetical protein, partial [Negativicoccus succinicivorans]|uniref:hypothetical protein n=1 Tax=Negativicoccus succinicivorans TaxID=620903 RepID=UPI00292D2D7C